MSRCEFFVQFYIIYSLVHFYRKRLECPLMVRSTIKRQLLDINFDHYLLKLFAEISYWELLMFEIPHYAADVYQRREELRLVS